MNLVKLIFSMMFQLEFPYRYFCIDSIHCKQYFEQILRRAYNAGGGRCSRCIRRVERSLEDGGRLHLLTNIEDRRNMSLNKKIKITISIFLLRIGYIIVKNELPIMKPIF